MNWNVSPTNQSFADVFQAAAGISSPTFVTLVSVRAACITALRVSTGELSSVLTNNAPVVHPYPTMPSVASALGSYLATCALYSCIAGLFALAGSAGSSNGVTLNTLLAAEPAMLNSTLETQVPDM